MAGDVFKHKLNVILIQIDEAHSDDWPVYIDSVLGVDQPKPHKTFEDRVARAKHFVEKYNPPYPLYIDSWSNDFAELFRAWPDKYHCIDREFKIIAKAEYNSDQKKEATVVEDYTDLLLKLMDK